jgi:hypothetical protein
MTRTTPSAETATPVHCRAVSRSPRYTRAARATMTGVTAWSRTTADAVEK